MKEKPKTGILQRFFKIICLAVMLTSAGFLIYHMVYLPMENKKLVAELKGNFFPGAGSSGSLRLSKKKTNQLEENARWLR